MATSVIRFACKWMVNYNVKHAKVDQATSPPAVANGWVLPTSIIILILIFSKRKENDGTADAFSSPVA
jgi:hypothetical protein